MDESQAWKSMTGAPRDGTRVLVTVRSVEQGPADVDLAYWAPADSHGIEGWRSADSRPGCVIAYADPELKGWMPLPDAVPGEPDPPRPPPYEGDEIDGSGI